MAEKVKLPVEFQIVAKKFKSGLKELEKALKQFQKRATTISKSSDTAEKGYTAKYLSYIKKRSAAAKKEHSERMKQIREYKAAVKSLPRIAVARAATTAQPRTQAKDDAKKVADDGAKAAELAEKRKQDARYRTLNLIYRMNGDIVASERLKYERIIQMAQRAQKAGDMSKTQAARIIEQANQKILQAEKKAADEKVRINEVANTKIAKAQAENALVVARASGSSVQVAEAQHQLRAAKFNQLLAREKISQQTHNNAMKTSAQRLEVDLANIRAKRGTKNIKQANDRAAAEVKANEIVARSEKNLLGVSQLTAQKRIAAIQRLTNARLLDANAAKKMQRQVAQAAAKSAKDIKQAGLGQIGTDLQTIGFRVGVLGAALGMAVKGAIQPAIDLEHALSAVKAVIIPTAEEFEELRNQSIELGRQSVFTAGEVAKGMKFMGQAGFTTIEILETMPNVLALAAAGELEMARAADIASGIIRGYGAETKELGHLIDVMAKTVTSANATLDDLAESFKYVGPVAANAGVPFEDVAASLAIIHNAGIKASMAGTAMRQSFSAMLAPTTAQAKVLKQLGVQLEDSTGDFIGYTGAIAEFEKAFAKIDSAAKKTGIAMKFFGDRAGPAMVALLNKGSVELDRYRMMLTDVDGVAKQMAETRLDNLKGALMRLQQAWEGLTIRVLSSFTGLKGFLQHITNMVKWFTEFATAQTIVTRALQTFFALISSVAVIFTFGAAVALLVGTFLQLDKIVMALVGTSFIRFGVGMKSLAVGIYTMSATFIKAMLGMGLSATAFQTKLYGVNATLGSTIVTGNATGNLLSWLALKFGVLDAAIVSTQQKLLVFSVLAAKVLILVAGVIAWKKAYDGINIYRNELKQAAKDMAAAKEEQRKLNEELERMGGPSEQVDIIGRYNLTTANLQEFQKVWEKFEKDRVRLTKKSADARLAILKKQWKKIATERKKDIAKDLVQVKGWGKEQEIILRELSDFYAIDISGSSEEFAESLRKAMKAGPGIRTLGERFFELQEKIDNVSTAMVRTGAANGEVMDKMREDLKKIQDEISFVDVLNQQEEAVKGVALTMARAFREMEEDTAGVERSMGAITDELIKERGQLALNAATWRKRTDLMTGPLAQQGIAEVEKLIATLKKEEKGYGLVGDAVEAATKSAISFTKREVKERLSNLRSMYDTMRSEEAKRVQSIAKGTKRILDMERQLAEDIRELSTSAGLTDEQKITADFAELERLTKKFYDAQSSGNEELAADLAKQIRPLALEIGKTAVAGMDEIMQKLPTGLKQVLSALGGDTAKQWLDPWLENDIKLKLNAKTTAEEMAIETGKMYGRIGDAVRKLVDEVGNYQIKREKDVQAEREKTLQSLRESIVDIKSAIDSTETQLKGFLRVMGEMSEQMALTFDLSDLENARTQIEMFKTQVELDSIRLSMDLALNVGGTEMSPKETIDFFKKLLEGGFDVKDTFTVDKLPGRTGGVVPGFADGGPLSGYGGGDKISAMLEAGEFVIRKEAVSKFGAPFFDMLNNMRLPDIQGLSKMFSDRVSTLGSSLPRTSFASGGEVVGSGGMYTLNLNVGDDTSQLFGSRDQIENLIEALRREGATSV